MRRRLWPPLLSRPEPSLEPLAEQLVTSLADRYRILGELGRGGMATVLLADDLKHGRKVAVKVMHPELVMAIGHDRFLREIEIAARLSHPHILPLFDSGAAGEHLYYVMPFIAGETLRERIERERPMPIEDAIRLTREIAGALGHAHAKGLVHRDIKPENVLLSDGIALVADFGIARATAREPVAGDASDTLAATTAGITLGTPLYMAPEQALGDAALDGRADQYSLGCVLYEMLAGQPPFTGASLSILAKRHANDPVPPLRSARPSVAEALERVIEKALSKTPADRYPSMVRFAEALGMAASGSAARTPTPVPEARDAAAAGNLPRQRTSFVGRARELAECARLMGETRLLTLTGVGGCGKTRLGLRLAEGLLEAHPEGAYWVDLAPVSDESRVPHTIASTIGLQEEPGHPLIDTIGRHFATRRALLVLDNCEHLLGATSDAADALLSSTTELRLIVTSREGLGISGEHVFALRSLTVPAAAGPSDLHVVADSDAVKLFVDRARQAAPEFALTPQNAAAVAEICRRLDGMPLAIELAAARIRMLTVEQIRSRLDDRFKLLTGGQKALPRHQTLRATIQWSHDQLETPEQALFRDMAVFAGGWTLADAVAVMGDVADEFEVLDLLTRLADKSLINVDRDAGGEARYTMLETVRQFAQEILQACPERDRVRDRHLDHFIACAQQYERGLREQRAEQATRVLERQFENILAAHAWCDHATNGAERGYRLLSPLGRFFGSSFRIDLGHRLVLEALARGTDADHPTLRSRLHADVANLLYYRGAYAESRLPALLSLRLVRGSGDAMAILHALDAASSSACAAGEFAEARTLTEEYVTAAKASGDSVHIVAALTYAGELRRMELDLEGAGRIYEELLPMMSALGSEQSQAMNYDNLAMIRSGLGQATAAERAVRAAAEHASRCSSTRVRVATLDTAAGIVAARGDFALAARWYGASALGYARSGASREPADALFHEPLLARARSSLGDSGFDAAHAEGYAMPVESSFAEVLEWLRRNVPEA